MIVRDARGLGAAARDARRELGWSQAKLADEAGVSRQWIGAFEKGKPRIELGQVLRVLVAMDLAVDVVKAPRTPSILDRILDGDRS